MRSLIQVNNVFYHVRLSVFLVLLTVITQVNATCKESVKAITPLADFIVHDDGTATHISSGLMWKVCSEGLSWIEGTCTGAISRFSWDQALMQPKTQNSNGGEFGYSDWRLPNIRELSSIVEFKCIQPAVNSVVFPGLSRNSSVNWSSTPFNDDKAWHVDFSRGDVNVSTRTGNLPVRLVRSSDLYTGEETLTEIMLGKTFYAHYCEMLETYEIGLDNFITSTYYDGSTERKQYDITGNNFALYQDGGVAEVLALQSVTTEYIQLSGDVKLFKTAQFALSSPSKECYFGGYTQYTNNGTVHDVDAMVNMDQGSRLQVNFKDRSGSLLSLVQFTTNYTSKWEFDTAFTDARLTINGSDLNGYIEYEGIVQSVITSGLSIIFIRNGADYNIEVTGELEFGAMVISDIQGFSVGFDYHNGDGGGRS